ncbi:uncharacterized protein HMPREF1541_04938 [Cyphellophora europaea CBS 101466]|uniref:Nudix hydrolase domain-containing protein n=1 Tax=Cyphellophora europaea (strain CBS 101466) TaxID=1220924 RepID=W2RYA2_CYPE1|nr:uncharacterized protein HMPREF1541_04938 [Cyphellophora europaea CBS 101466]ETN40659.1 hypothetical protein HMPREF1541_04938 [Cyphellophora europaea CBS 101466]
MSTLKLPSSGHFPGVTVKLPSNLRLEQLLSYRPFNNWLSALSKSLALQHHPQHPFHSEPYNLREIEIQSVDFFSEKRLGFLKLRASITNEKNESLPGSVFMRGGSVAMLIVLSPANTSAGDDYALMTVQPRIAAGSLSFVELPAGMIDDAGTFTGAAAKEIKEETGLDIKEDELIDMTQLTLKEVTSELDREGGVEAHLQEGMYPSPGGCDEFMPIYLARKKMAKEEMEILKGKLTGLRDHGEKITLKLVKLKDVWKVGVRDGKTLAAIALHDGLVRAGKL